MMIPRTVPRPSPTMRSKAQFKNHPLHPILIPFPIAFLIGGTVADWVGRIGSLSGWSAAASYLLMAGVATALVAAVPGAVDYFYAVPPDSTGRKRATYHAVVNLSAVGLFGVALAMKGWPPAAPRALALLLELAGVALVTAGGGVGGKLVHRKLNGGGHRHAHAGEMTGATV